MTPRRVEKTIDRHLPNALRAARRIRYKLLTLTGNYRRRKWAFIPAVVELLKAEEPVIADPIARGQVAAWVNAANAVAQSLPFTSPVVQPAWTPGGTIPPSPPPPVQTAAPAGDEPPERLLLPKVAAENLRQKFGYTPEEFAALSDDAKAVGFTVARAISRDAVAKIQEALARDVETGGTLGQFRTVVEEALAPSALAEHQIEGLYRTQVGRAYSGGQQLILSHPMVADEFPYLLYSATHDSRVRPEHLAMESLGLDSTAVYRADDPIWNWFLPPWSWNCRCITIPISIEQAASYGVREAKEWVRTGNPPVYPQYVPMLPFLPPRGWIPTGSRLSIPTDRYAELSQFATVL